MDSRNVCLESEIKLLNYVLTHTDEFFKNFADFEAECFAVEYNREIYKYVLQLQSQNKPIPSPTTLSTIIKSDTTIEEKNILLMQKVLHDVCNHTTAIQDGQILTDTLNKLYVSRRVALLKDSVIPMLNANDIGDAIDKLLNGLSKLKDKLEDDTYIDVMSFKNDIDKRIAHANELLSNPNATGMVMTGFHNFDSFIPRQGPGEFIIYQSRTNMGKSMFLMGTAIKNYAAGLKVVVITIEMNAMQWATRIDSALSAIKHSEFTHGTIVKDTELTNRWCEAVRVFGNTSNKHDDLMIYWQPSGCTPAVVERILARNPFKPDLVIIDYAGDMNSGLKGVSQYDPKSHAEIYSRLKEIAGKFKCVVYTAQQTKRGEKKVSDESGSWTDVASNKADIMIAIEKEKEDELFEAVIDGRRFSERLTITIVKGRGIPKNIYTNVIPDFTYMRWYEKKFDEMRIKGKTVDETTDKQKNKNAMNKLGDTVKQSEKKVTQSNTNDIPDLFDDPPSVELPDMSEDDIDKLME